MAKKHLTPEEMSFLADGKILHGFGKVPSTEGKSSLDAVNFGTLVTNPPRAIGRHVLARKHEHSARCRVRPENVRTGAPSVPGAVR